MSDPDFKSELRSYLVGFGLALGLTALPFAFVVSGIGSHAVLVVLVAACALAQLIVQLRYFLHLDLSQQKREDLHLVLFTALVLGIMCVGTIWIMGNLATRM